MLLVTDVTLKDETPWVDRVRRELDATGFYTGEEEYGAGNLAVLNVSSGKRYGQHEAFKFEGRKLFNQTM